MALSRPLCIDTRNLAVVMADIFISYAHEDRESAEHIAQVLEAAGFSVWWDRRIPAGRTWRSVLEEALQGMRCLIVLWSENSIKSTWVIEEAEEARRLGKIMLPVLIHKINPPVGFRAIQAAKLIDWSGAADAPAVELLVADLKALLGEPKAPSNGNVEPDRVNDSASDDNPRADPLRSLFVRNWKILAGGGAAIALILVALQISWPGRTAIDAPPAQPINEPLPARQLTAIAIAGAPRELKPADMVALKLQGIYSDGTNSDIADSIKWTISDSRVAAVDDQGNLKALQPGTAEVSARLGDLVSKPWTVAVTSIQKVVDEIPAVKMVQLAITPARKELFANERIALRVIARYSDQSERPIGRELRWHISDPTIAAITSDGQLSGLRTGRVDISVRAGEVVSAPILIVVKDRPKKAQVETLSVKPNTESKALAPPPLEPARPRLAPYIARAKSLREQGQYAAAVAELQKAAAIDPSNAEVIKEIDQTRRACAAERSLGQKIEC